MKLSVVLVSGGASTGYHIIARSADPYLVRQFIAALQNNRLLEDDEDDVIFDPIFLVEGDQMAAGLSAQIRQNAGRLFSETDADGGPRVDRGRAP